MKVACDVSLLGINQLDAYIMSLEIRLFFWDTWSI